MIVLEPIKAGLTSQTIDIDVWDSSSSIGARLAGLVFDTAGLTAHYSRQNAPGAWTAITLVTMTKGTWAAGGFVQSDNTNAPGTVQLGIPDALLAAAAGVGYVQIRLKGAANMVPVEIRIPLTANVAQTGDGYAVVAHADHGNAQLVRSTVPANKLDVSATGEAGLDFDNFKAAATAKTLTNITVPTVTTVGTTTTNTDMRGTDSAALASVCTEARLAELAAANLPADIDAILVDTGTDIPARFAGVEGATFATGTDSLEAIRDRGDAAWKIGLASGTAQGGAVGSITLAAGASAADDLHNGTRILIHTGTGAGQSRIITDYVGATKVATIGPLNWAVTPDATSQYEIQGADGHVGMWDGVEVSGAVALASALTTHDGKLDVVDGIVDTLATEANATANKAAIIDVFDGYITGDTLINQLTQLDAGGNIVGSGGTVIGVATPGSILILFLAADTGFTTPKRKTTAASDGTWALHAASGTWVLRVTLDGSYDAAEGDSAITRTIIIA